MYYRLQSINQSIRNFQYTLHYTTAVDYRGISVLNHSLVCRSSFNTQFIIIVVIIISGLIYYILVNN